jgi:hypothetical protein
MLDKTFRLVSVKIYRRCNALGARTASMPQLSNPRNGMYIHSRCSRNPHRHMLAVPERWLRDEMELRVPFQSESAISDRFF